MPSEALALTSTHEKPDHLDHNMLVSIYQKKVQLTVYFYLYNASDFIQETFLPTISQNL